MAFVALILADAHVRERRGDEQFALQQVVKLAHKYEVSLVIGLGDLLDKQTNRASALAIWSEFVSELKGIPFYHIRGNHDFDEPSWLTCVGSPNLNKTRLTVGPYEAYGLDYQPIFKLQEELAQVPDDITMLLCHQAWSDWMGDITSPQGDFGQIPGHIEALLTGDLHMTVIETAKNAGGEDMWVVSPGATCSQKIAEPHEHFVVLVDDEGRFHRKPLRSRIFIDSSVLLTTEDLDAFLAGIGGQLDIAEQRAAANDYPPALMKPYLRYTFKHSLSDAVRRVEKAAGNRAILYAKQMPPEEKTQSSKALELIKGAAVTPLSVLDQEIDRDTDEATYELVSRLLASNNPEIEFAAWRAERTIVDAPSDEIEEDE